MPQIKQYDAPLESLTESTRGAQAFEQAGRRLGPLYNEAATFQREEGKLAAQAFKEMQWPADIAKLRASVEASKPVGINFRGGGGGGRGSREVMPDYGATGQISRGAGALGNALSDGGYELSTDTGDEEVGVGTFGASENIKRSASDKAQASYNSALDREVSDYTNKLWDYQTRYYGPDVQYKTDRSGDAGGAFGPANPQPSTSGGWFSGLSNWISSSSGGTDQTGGTSSGL